MVLHTEHKIDWSRKQVPLAHNNQNTKYTVQIKIIKSCEGNKQIT